VAGRRHDNGADAMKTKFPDAGARIDGHFVILSTAKAG
jgi:hypothetical protein